MKVLDYSATLTNPYLNETGSYYAYFTCTATPHDVPPNWTIVDYTWTPTVPFPSGWEPTGLQLTFPSPGKGQTQTGTAYTAGEHTAKVTMKLMDDMGHFHSYSDDANVAAIGGSLQLSVWDSEIPTFEKDEGVSTKPVYLQYFGHDPVQPAGSVKQRAQKGKFNPAIGQPPGTVFSTTVSGSVEIISDSSGVVTFGMLESSSTGGVVPHITFSLTYNGGSGLGQDCSAHMPNPQTYTFTSHAPKTLTAALASEHSRNRIDYSYNPPAQIYGWDRTDNLHLDDHLDQPMPGVFVQERFDPNTPLPSGFWASNYTYLWQTVMDPPGDANAQDHFFIDLFVPHTYAVYPNSPYWDLHQEYWAGTRDPNWGGLGGIKVGDFDIKYWSDRIDHDANTPPPSSE